MLNLLILVLSIIVLITYCAVTAIAFFSVGVPLKVALIWPAMIYSLIKSCNDDTGDYD